MIAPVPGMSASCYASLLTLEVFDPKSANVYRNLYLAMIRRLDEISTGQPD